MHQVKPHPPSFTSPLPTLHGSPFVTDTAMSIPRAHSSGRIYKATTAIALASGRRRSSIVGALIKFEKGFVVLVRDFLLESALTSTVAALLPVLVTLFATKVWVEAVAEQHYNTDLHPPALFLAPAMYANVTAAPIKGYYTERFFMAAKGPAFVNHYLGPSGQNGFVAFTITAFRALLMFRCTPQEGTCIVIIGLVCGYLIAYLLATKKEMDHLNGKKTSLGYTYEFATAGVYVFVMPALAALAALASKKRRSIRQAAGAFVLFSACSLVEYIVLEVMEKGLLPLFFAPGLSALSSFILRGPLMMTLVTGMIEASWQLSKFAVTKLDVESQDSHALLAAATAVIPLYGRLMQSSAETAGASLYYEVIGTGMELMAMHALLKGNTPWKERVNLIKYALRGCKHAPVTPEEQVESTESKKDDLRRKFCASCMIMMSLGEASAVITSSFYFLIMNVNPSSAGSKRIPQSQTLTNFAIMFAGEFILTDGLVSWMSNKRTTYKVDLSKEWERVKENKAFLIAIVVLTSSLGTLALISTTKNFCVTSRLEDVESWVLTTCPPYPNITDVARSGVGEEFLELWQKYN